MTDVIDPVEVMLAKAWREGRDWAVRSVEQQIMDGYPKRLPLGEKCPHGVLNGTDCIGCYDEALMSRLTAIRKDEPTQTLIAGIATVGAVLVPEVPTREMVKAAHAVWSKNEQERYERAGSFGQIARSGWAEEYYAAMLSARPTLTGPEQATREGDATVTDAASADDAGGASSE